MGTPHAGTGLAPVEATSCGARGCPCRLAGRSLQASCLPLARCCPRFGILPALGQPRRSIGTGNPSMPSGLDSGSRIRRIRLNKRREPTRARTRPAGGAARSRGWKPKEPGDFAQLTWKREGPECEISQRRRLSSPATHSGWPARAIEAASYSVFRYSKIARFSAASSTSAKSWPAALLPGLRVSKYRRRSADRSFSAGMSAKASISRPTRASS